MEEIKIVSAAYAWYMEKWTEYRMDREHYEDKLESTTGQDRKYTEELIGMLRTREREAEEAALELDGLLLELLRKKKGEGQ